VERTRIQPLEYVNETGLADEAKTTAVVNAMRHTFETYRELAWGSDGIKPISGKSVSNRNGWGCFIVDSASTLALMGLWTELKLSIEHIKEIDFNQTDDLVDPFETTIRYVGGLVSLVDLIDFGAVPESVASKEDRDAILAQAVHLSDKLAPAYDSPTGMPWPRVNFETDQGEPDPEDSHQQDSTKPRYEHPAIGPARIGSSILEFRSLSRLARDMRYTTRSIKAWAHLVWSQWIEPFSGLVDGPMDIMTGAPVGRERHWDAGHDSYYEYLIKAAILDPGSRHAKTYTNRWTNASFSLRNHLASRSAPSPPTTNTSHFMQHQFIGKYDNDWYVNEQSHLACFAPGNLILGGTFLERPHLVSFGRALLEGCRHTYNASASGIGPEVFSWKPSWFSSPGFRNKTTFTPQTDLQKEQLHTTGFWVADPVYRLRPEYVESLFYAWRITGDLKYREWAWEAFAAIQRECRTRFGFATLADVTVQRPNAGEGFKGRGRLKAQLAREKHADADEKKKHLAAEDFTPGAQLEANAELVGGDELHAQAEAAAQGGELLEGDDREKGLLDEQESFWAAETLKYFYLTFADVRVGSLDQWVYSTEGHPFRVIG
jgi:mannosyl-oligosaccharide alpha-1,2-mannosidase